MTIKRYAGDKFTGTSADTKPTNIPEGGTFFETDTGRVYIRVSGTWTQTTNSGTAAGGLIWENDQTAAVSYTMTANKNGLTAGPITIASGVTITIPSGAAWTIV